MIRISDVESFEDKPSVAKLTQMVLLMALRDKADQILFDPYPQGLRLRYRSEGILYDLVPVPLRVLPRLVQYFREHACLTAAVQPYEGLWTRFIGRHFESQVSAPEIGWLSVQFLNYRLDVSILITPDPLGEHVRLEILTPYDGPEPAAILATLTQKSPVGLIELAWP
jgi:hypothetical protein